MTSDLPVGINYSGGTSSEDMIEMVRRGEIKRPSLLAVFFAEVGEEHAWTYERVNEVEERCKSSGIRFIRCSLGPRLGDVMLDWAARKVERMDNPPLWIDKGDGQKGRLNQRCSQRFKSEVIRKAQWRWLKSMGMPRRIASWIGFAADEKQRAQKALARKGPKWVTLDFPAIRLGRTRAHQRRFLEQSIGDAPKFSMCVGCPWKTPARWKETTGADLTRAIQLDDAIRDIDQTDLATEGQAYLSDRLIPVRDLVRKPTNEIDEMEQQPGCDAGACFL